METASPIAAFFAQRACLANVAGLEKPHARERGPLVHQALNQTLENDGRRSFLGERERDLLQRPEAHGREASTKYR